MSQKELCRSIIAKIREIERENPGLERLEEGPVGIFSGWPTGMPRGSNNPIMALLQRMDVDEAIEKIEEYCAELDRLAG